jgi:hypothetical protein
MKLRGFDYLNSGLSTTEAVADARIRTERALAKWHLPRWLVRVLATTLSMTMSCDGSGCKCRGRTSGVLDAEGVWRHSGGWVHRQDLDFCPRCQHDGSMHHALAAGVRPRGG